MRDCLAGIRDVIGGRTRSYENALNGTRRITFRDLMDAEVGVDIDYQIISKRGAMLIVSITSTAVTVTPSDPHPPP